MTNANTLELAMLDLINAERAAAGLEDLRLITLLNSAAEDHSRWMLETNTFSHDGVDGSSPSDRMEAAGYEFLGNSLSLENIGWQSARGEEGFADDVAQVHAGLMASPGHRANILNPDAEDIGIGIEIGTFSGNGGDFEAVMVTQVFGTTAADMSAWVDPGTGETDDDMVPEDDMVEDDVVADDDAPDTDDDVTGDEVVCETDDTGDDVDGPVDDGEVDEGSDDEATDEDAGDEEDQGDEEADEDSDNDDMVAEDDSSLADDDTDGGSSEEADDEVVADDPTIAPPLPCDLADFRVDLRDAFEFRQEGDQLIWETSEDRLMEVFMKAFEDWSEGAVETVGDEPGIEDLMIDEDVSPADLTWANADEEPTEDWMFDTCA